uniref:Uncharacterized protein n=2 Tax=Salarias fasciatus TaxID=181472 RepID=A0A672FJN3_SALFA
SLEAAALWLEQTGCSLPLALDPQRKLYRTFGLGSSYAKVIQFDLMLRYSEFPVANRDFPDIAPRLLEDIYQMGGNFLLDDAGKVLLSHPCKTTVDRPSASDVVKVADAADALA